MTYATTTTVSPARSREEIERVLRRYGADSFSYGWDESRDLAAIQFSAHNRRIRFILPVPSASDPSFTRTPTGQPRSATAASKAYEQAVRSRWRALFLVVKAKLEAVDSGIVSFESEFLAHIVLPNGATVGETAVPAIEHAYAQGSMPDLLAIER